ncbi:unnamed protein product [Caenorhabditis angaria]|uniref:Peptidase M1 membrane alanine aminopeptidase domain-containing protein n=1 Tax=Caenorhabditis angaria TaxID=860376 RepID=A0A9P1IWM5_9PELO|nr:unnamed protein product [Caenorhabditis angaria]
MENWGLITVRQAEALFMEKKFPILQKHQTQEVIAHEVAHQWFGNLVTMKWWNNLWLNEGFATMIGVKAIDFLANTTTQYSEMSPEYMCLSLRQDQKLNSIAVSHERNDSNGFLDSNSRIIVYKKAAIIIRMIERLVEEDVFQEGLHRFLDKHRYSNADHMDLFDELTHVHSSSSGGHLSGQVFSLNDVMDTWLRQPSFPVVHVRRENSSHLVLNQQRYNHNPRIRSDRENFTWIIPIFHDDPITQKHKVVWIVDKNEILFNNTAMKYIQKLHNNYHWITQKYQLIREVD